MQNPRTLPSVIIPEFDAGSPGGQQPILDYDEAAGPVAVEQEPKKPYVYNVQTVAVAKGASGSLIEWAEADYWNLYIIGGAAGDILYVRPGDSPCVGVNEAVLTQVASGIPLRLPCLRRGGKSLPLYYLAPAGNTNTVTLVAIATSGYGAGERP